MLEGCLVRFTVCNGFRRIGLHLRLHPPEVRKIFLVVQVDAHFTISTIQPSAWTLRSRRCLPTGLADKSVRVRCLEALATPPMVFHMMAPTRLNHPEIPDNCRAAFLLIGAPELD